MLLASTYGWTHREILYGLTARQFFMYVEKIPVLEARMQMARIESSTFPHMREVSQKQTLKGYERIIKLASSTEVSSQKIIDTNWNLLRKGITPHG